MAFVLTFIALWLASKLVERMIINRAQKQLDKLHERLIHGDRHG